jgi:hypoxanthine phosphoribosyltransferase
MSFIKPADYVPPHRVQPLYNAPTIAERMSGMATEIAEQLGDEFLIVGILKGSFVFIADLVRALHYAGCAPQVDFMTISSYGAGKESSGKLTIARDISDDVTGKKILLADDILESGRTLHSMKRYLLERGAEVVHSCVLLDKPSRRVEAIEADTVGFTILDVFVVGYGLDYAGYYRELPFIGKL